MDFHQTTEKTSRQAAVLEEWRRQFVLLSLEDQKAIERDALGPEADRLEASVRAAIAAKYDLPAEIKI
jgi:hypothetical protein